MRVNTSISLRVNNINIDIDLPGLLLTDLFIELQIYPKTCIVNKLYNVPSNSYLAYKVVM